MSSQPREWASLLGSPCHSINTSIRGQGKKYFGLGDKMEKTFLSALPFSNPQPAPPQKRKKKEKSSMCTEGKGKRGKVVLFSFTIKKSQQDVLRAASHTFQTVTSLLAAGCQLANSVSVNLSQNSCSCVMSIYKTGSVPFQFVGFFNLLFPPPPPRQRQRLRGSPEVAGWGSPGHPQLLSQALPLLESPSPSPRRDERS